MACVLKTKGILMKMALVTCVITAPVMVQRMQIMTGIVTSRITAPIAAMQISLMQTVMLLAMSVIQTQVVEAADCLSVSRSAEYRINENPKCRGQQCKAGGGPKFLLLVLMSEYNRLQVGQYLLAVFLSKK
jgi:hypothetical protein